MTHQLQLQRLVQLLDLTRLADQDSNVAFGQWLDELAEIRFSPAAFCVYPQFLSVTQALIHRQQLPAKLATVVNFPTGEQPCEQVVLQVQQALALGAEEIDCVLPYRALLAGDHAQVKTFLQVIRQATAGCCLKVIIESGELSTPQQIIKATELCIDAGADFVKSSTGKVAVGITTEAARSMLTVIAAAGRPVGFKASGGVRTVAQALELVAMYETITGQVAQPATMRIGASTLYTELVALLQLDG